MLEAVRMHVQDRHAIDAVEAEPDLADAEILRVGLETRLAELQDQLVRDDIDRGRLGGAGGNAGDGHGESGEREAQGLHGCVPSVGCPTARWTFDPRTFYASDAEPGLRRPFRVAS